MSSYSTTPSLPEKLESLGPLLSSACSVHLSSKPGFELLSQRWSDLSAPAPGALIDVATEDDVVATVKWALANKVRFLAQGGTHGYQINRTIGADDIVINTRPMAKTEIDTETMTAIIGAGTLVAESNDVAMEKKVHVPWGTCNGVGVIGAMVGGGVGNFQGLYGPAIDSIVSMRMVTAKGDLIEISAASTGEEKDLWYAMRGAGHAFGLVTSMKIRVYPEINGGMLWSKLLVYAPTPEKMQEVGQIMHDHDLGHKSSATILLMPMPPNGEPGFAVSLWYAGTPEDAKAHFAPYFAAGPVAEMGAPEGVTPANGSNAGGDVHATKGGRKPVACLTYDKLDPCTVVPIWELYKDFVTKNPDAAKFSMVMLEAMPTQIQRGRPGGSEEQGAYPWRRYDMHAVCLAQYDDPAVDEAAMEYGVRFRKIAGGEKGHRSVYVGFALGDETPEDVYGKENVEKLRSIKRVWDPENVFRGPFPLI